MWKTVELQEIIEGLFDGPHATPKESDSGAIFLGIKNVSEDGRLDLSDVRYIAMDDMARWTKRVTPRHKDIVLSYEATLHRYARIPENFVGCLGRRMALIRIDETKCNSDFLFSYFLSSVWRKEVEKYILPGATVDRIPLTTLPKFKLTIPPLPIQKKIAGVLSAYDDLIEANLKRIKLLEEMAQVTYEEWFVRLRFPGHETAPINPKTGLPDGWALKNLGEVATIKWGDTSTTKSKYIANGFTAYSASGPDGFLDYFDYDKTGVVLSAIGAYAGLTWLALGKWSAIKNTMVFWPNDQNLSVYYLYLATRSPDYWNRRGAAQPFIALGDARLQKILTPSEIVIERFENICAPIFNEIDVLKKTNLLLKEARDLLLPRLMTGLIDIDDYLARNASQSVAA